MVESEAKELSEDVMLGAVMFGQQHFQPVIDAIVKLAERAAKEPWDLKVDTSAEELAAKVRDASPKPTSARPTRSRPSMSAATASPRSRTRRSKRWFQPTTTARLPPKVSAAFKDAEKRRGALLDPRDRSTASTGAT